MMGEMKGLAMKKVKELPAFSRPREKLQEKGAEALSDTELVAAILGSGQGGQDVLTIAARVAREIARSKGRLTLEKVAAIKGIGPAKAAQILAGFELARRHIVKDTVKINGPESVLPLVGFITGKKQEYFVCISLNGANEVIDTRVVTIGLLDKSPVHPREVFADVITDRAAAVIFVHNHPSGDLRPSQSDFKTHKQLSEAARILGINVLDHMIVTPKGYYSFSENDKLD